MAASALAVALLTASGACDKPRGQPAKSVESGTASPKAEPPGPPDSLVLARLRSISQELTGDTIVLWAPMGAGDDAMRGAPVGAEMERFFAREYGDQLALGDNVFALGWLRIAPALEVHLLRTPSQYDPSALTLWVFDGETRTWSPPLEIADGFGDAGWTFRKQAWLMPQSGGRELGIVVHRTDWEMDLESDSSDYEVIADSLYAVDLRAWVRRAPFVRLLPDSLKAHFPVVGDPLARVDDLMSGYQEGRM